MYFIDVKQWVNKIW